VKIDQDSSLRADPALSAAVAENDGVLAAAVNGSVAEATWGLDTSGRSPRVLLRLRTGEGRPFGGAEFDPVDVRYYPARFADGLGELGAALRTVTDWLPVVGRLFDRLVPWCEALPGDPVVTRGVCYVEEAQSGGYEAPELRVGHGGREMFIRPVAVWVIGWDGRVDMIGPDDRAVLHYTRATDSWHHVPNYLPYRELPLTAALFRELTEACLFDE
jgi:hypothetical protein